MTFSVRADTEATPVRVGYYENELFQEDAEDNEMNQMIAKPYDIPAMMETLRTLLNRDGQEGDSPS